MKRLMCTCLVALLAVGTSDSFADDSANSNILAGRFSVAPSGMFDGTDFDLAGLNLSWNADALLGLDGGSGEQAGLTNDEILIQMYADLRWMYESNGQCLLSINTDFDFGGDFSGAGFGPVLAGVEVPEPATMGLLALGGAMLAFRRYRRNR